MAINKRLIKSNDEGGGVSFNTVLYTGNGNSNRTINGVGFNPDLVWIKARNAAESHALFDVQRPAGQRLVTNSAAAALQLSPAYAQLTTDGFIVGGASYNDSSSGDYVAWCWKAGGAAVTNTDGTTTSQVSANVEAGFSIATWTGTGGNGTVGHGLGVAPKIYIIKTRSSANDWTVLYNGSLFGSSGMKYLSLNKTDAQTTAGQGVPTSEILNILSTYGNGSGLNWLAYCFAEVAGFSKFGSYTGATPNSVVVNTGFEPAFVLIKRSSSAGSNWVIWDNKRDATNPRSSVLFPNTSALEYTASTIEIDFNSSGFEVKGSDGGINANGSTFIYMAFANQF